VLTRTVEHHHPKGLVGVISPWDYPLTLAVSDAIPALLAGDGMALARDETFGPVVAVARVADADEAVRRANDTEYGLNASVWSTPRRGAEMEKYASVMTAGLKLLKRAPFLR
jgi:acyl-CoA reductase-like NAD-dependent aldehyde dehydrogenase